MYKARVPGRNHHHCGRPDASNAAAGATNQRGVHAMDNSSSGSGEDDDSSIVAVKVIQLDLDEKVRDGIPTSHTTTLTRCCASSAS